jgi:N-terminal half of MaoC dehydratase
MTRDPLAKVEERLRNQVGDITTERLGVLRRHDFLRFAVASADADYLELIDGLPPGAPAPAPTLYVPGILHWTPGPVEAELRSDGLTERDAPGVGEELVNVMHGGQVIAFHRPVCEGADLHARRMLRSVERKVGRASTFLLVIATTEFAAGDDDSPLITVDDSILVVPR